MSASRARVAALLRAINVGGRTVKMDELRTLFTSLGLDGVETVIASGNVLFDHPGGRIGALERRISSGLGDALGYEVPVFLRTGAELADVLARLPFDSSSPAAPDHVIFLAAPPARAAIATVEALTSATNEFVVSGREVYWRRHERSPQSLAVGAKAERALGVPGTARNVNTVRKLATKLGAA